MTYYCSACKREVGEGFVSKDKLKEIIIRNCCKDCEMTLFKELGLNTGETDDIG